MARHAAERPDVRDSSDGCGAHGVVRRRFRHRSKLLGIGQAVERQRSVAVSLARRCGNGDEPIGYLATQVVIALAARECHELGYRVDPDDGRAPYAHVFI